MDPVSAKQLRQELRAWLESNWDPNASLIQWRTKLTESGWGMPTWPSQWFGKDLPQALNPIVEEEFARINAVTVARTGIRLLAAATILEHGNDDQKSRYLPRILTGEDTWCQLFSEPGSGSDLAGAITRADFDGTHWIVNGQKVETWQIGTTQKDGGVELRLDSPPIRQGANTVSLMRTKGGSDVGLIESMDLNLYYRH